jgi:hypothetical protein
MNLNPRVSRGPVLFGASDTIGCIFVFLSFCHIRFSRDDGSHFGAADTFVWLSFVNSDDKICGIAVH